MNSISDVGSGDRAGGRLPSDPAATVSGRNRPASLPELPSVRQQDPSRVRQKPPADTAETVSEAVSSLRARPFHFVKWSEMTLRQEASHNRLTMVGMRPTIYVY